MREERSRCRFGTNLGTAKTARPEPWLIRLFRLERLGQRPVFRVFRLRFQLIRIKASSIILQLLYTLLIPPIGCGVSS